MSAWIIRIALVALVLIGGWILRDRMVGDLQPLKVGDCLDLPAQGQRLTDIQGRACTEGHQAEVFAVINHPAASGARPLTDADVNAFLADVCEPLWIEYVGQAAVDTGTLEFSGLFPVDDDWNDGRRTVTCITYRADRAVMTSSLKR